jgi:hypothetical protein
VPEKDEVDLSKQFRMPHNEELGHQIREMLANI